MDSSLLFPAIRAKLRAHRNRLAALRAKLRAGGRYASRLPGSDLSHHRLRHRRTRA
jgi:hypothetical protein